jgi:hypothetical protein
MRSLSCSARKTREMRRRSCNATSPATTPQSSNTVALASTKLGADMRAKTLAESVP